MKILVIGAGAYGLSLAQILSIKNDVSVYSVIKEEIDELNKKYSTPLFPNIKLNENIKFINEISNNYELVVIALPINYIEKTISNLKINSKVLIASKGINDVTHEFSYDIVSRYFDDISIISGPSFAIDMIKLDEICLTIAGDKELKNIFPNNIKIDAIDDIKGIQICGSIKNIFAISCGILEGLNKSESTKASYLTKIINESKKIIKELNGDEKTFDSYCGIGDTILTCNSNKSRNYSLGVLIGENKDYIEFVKNNTVEGYNALKSIKYILDKENVSNELINIIFDIVINNESPTLLINYLLN